VTEPETSSRRPSDSDEGVASERTVLAWERTAIATVALALVVLRAGIVDRLLIVALPSGALLVCASAGEWLLSARVYERRRSSSARSDTFGDPAMLMIAAIAVIATVASLLLAVDG
jgi:uncharacterized membrane protein YidH (DUF202 family)